MSGVSEAESVTVWVGEVQGVGELVGRRWYKRVSSWRDIPSSCH